MKVTTRIIAAFVASSCLVGLVAVADSGVGVLGTYHVPDDGDAGFGALVRCQWDADPDADSIRLLAQVGYLSGFGDDVYSGKERRYTAAQSINVEAIRELRGENALPQSRKGN